MVVRAIDASRVEVIRVIPVTAIAIVNIIPAGFGATRKCSQEP